MARHARTLLGALTVPVAGLALVLSGCEASSPQQEEPGARAVVPLPAEDLRTVMFDQQDRNNDAIAAADPPDFDAGGYEESTAGWLLEAVRADTRLRRLSEERGVQGAVTGSAGDVYPVAFSDHPVSAVVTNDPQTLAAGPDTRLLTVLAQSRPSAPWLAEFSVPVPDKQLPGPTTARELTEEDLGRADDAAAAYVRYLESGEGLDDGRARVVARADLLEEESNDDDDAEVESITVEAEPYTDNLSGDDGVWAAPTEEGLLVVVTLRTSTTLVAAPGSRYRWTAPFDSFWGGSTMSEVLRRADIVGAVLHVGDDGTELLADRISVTERR